MSVIRVNKTANYTVLSNYHFKEKKMSLKAKGLLSLMLSLPDDWNYSISGLVSLSKDGKDSVMSALGELEEFGYLTRVRTTDSKGKFTGVEYNIYEQPQEKKPVAEKRNSVKTYEENPQLLNTNKSNNKELNTDGIYIEEYSPILNEIQDIELRNLFVDYIEMRRNIDAPIRSIRGLSMLINRCERLSNFDVELQKALLEAAIMNEWKNVYLPNEQDVQNNTTLAKLKRFYSR